MESKIRKKRQKGGKSASHFMARLGMIVGGVDRILCLLTVFRGRLPGLKVRREAALTSIHALAAARQDSLCLHNYLRLHNVHFSWHHKQTYPSRLKTGLRGTSASQSVVLCDDVARIVAIVGKLCRAPEDSSSISGGFFAGWRGLLDQISGRPSHERRCM